MGQQDTFTRRICAVLLADVTGFSALVGEDDERTARTIRRLGSIVLEIVAEAKGHAEARAGDAILATFDSVVAAVDAALAIHRRIAAEEFAGRRLQVRIGIHFGDVLLREGASSAEAVGDAINIAARLQALAKPGTVCISDGVYRHVRNRFDEKFIDLGNQQLKNISGPVHAYLIVPRELADTSLPARRHSTLKYASAVAGLALVALAAVVLSRHYQGASTDKPAQRKSQSVT